MAKALRPEDKKWLLELDAQISRVSDPDRTGRRHRFSERDMTMVEWRGLTRLIKEYELPCVMFGLPYGFGVGVYDHGTVKGEKPDAVFGFEYFQVPGIQRGFVHQVDAARKLSALTHTARNQELLQWYGFGPLREPEYYTY